VLAAQVCASALRQHRTDKEGVEHPMTAANLLVVAPYNVQVNLLKRMLPTDARVVTVDKFQGQEAELVIVSMTTSSEQDLPRHLEFLSSKNRPNEGRLARQVPGDRDRQPGADSDQVPHARADGPG